MSRSRSDNVTQSVVLSFFVIQIRIIYISLCPSVGRSVSLFVCGSVGRLNFVKILKIFRNRFGQCLDITILGSNTYYIFFGFTF